MRLPVTSKLSTKDGTSNKNARLTNMLKETKKTGEKAVIRPGLVASDSYTGIGSGLIPFDGRLLGIFGNDIYFDDSQVQLDAPTWSASTTYSIGQWVVYSGEYWFSIADSNLNHAPASGVYWARQGLPTEIDIQTVLPGDVNVTGTTGDWSAFTGWSFGATVSYASWLAFLAAGPRSYPVAVRPTSSPTHYYWIQGLTDIGPAPGDNEYPAPGRCRAGYTSNGSVCILNNL